MSRTPGLIERIADLGLERDELARNPNGGGIGVAPVGGARVPYSPWDLAAVISIIRGLPAKLGLSLEGISTAGSAFLRQEVGMQSLTTIPAETPEKDLRRILRTMAGQFDFVAMDARGLSLPAEEIWKYLEGGKEARPAAFGAGMPRDYGQRNIKAGTFALFNLVDPGTKAVYHRLRSLHGHAYQSIHTGLVRL